MARFINSYGNGGSVLDIIEDINSKDVVIVGHTGTQGALKHITDIGDVSWSKSYSIGDQPIHFAEALSMDTLNQGIQFMTDFLEVMFETMLETLVEIFIESSSETMDIDQVRLELRDAFEEKLQLFKGGDKTGDILLLGRFIGSKGAGIDHLIIRVSKTGTPRWVKRIPIEQCPENLSLVKMNTSFALAGWHNDISGNDKVQIFRITGNGSLIKSAMIDHGGDDEIKQMISFGDALILVGGTNTSDSRTGFITSLNADLEVQDSHLLKVGSKRTKDTVHSIEILTDIVDGESIPAFDFSSYCIGTTALKTKTETFIAKFKSLDSKSEIEAVKFQASEKHDDIISVCSTSDYLFILGQDTSQARPPYLLKFTTNLELVWRKTIDLDEGFSLNKIVIKNQSEVWISGSLPKNAAGLEHSILIKTDFDLNTCKSIHLSEFAVQPIKVDIVKNDTKSHSINVEIIDHDFQSEDHRVDKNAICPTEADVEQPPFETSDGLWSQSPYLYLHAAGSPGHDASEGFLLRWFLLRNLGQMHLPKGDLATGTLGFNKPDDFVTIYRTKYDEKHQRTLDFESLFPVVIDAPQKRWVYDVDGQIYYLNFLDTDKYNLAEGAHAPETAPYEFLRTYGDGLLELEIRSNLVFSIEAERDGSGIAQIQMETFSVQGELAGEELGLSARKSFNTSAAIRVVAENIRKIVWRTSTSAIHILRFEFYTDFFNAKKKSGWQPLGRYALTSDTSEAALRLEDTTQFNVHGHWKKFQGDACINVQNYMDRWSDPSEGLQAGVQTYVALSDTDPTASKTYVEEVDYDSSPGAVNPSMDVSYLDLLQLASMDYHVARMLGLGLVDTSPDQNTDTFIYLAEYTTTAELDDGAPARTRQHIYQSLPTQLTDERLPHAVETLPVTYGLELNPGTPEAILLTDENGYLPYEAVRYVNVRVQPKDSFQQSSDFFDPATEYSTADFTRPVFAGISYKKDGALEWATPEISHLAPFLDASTNPVFETLPISFREDSSEPHYRHAETESGSHAYRGYGVNFYSRASDLGNTVKTNVTEFTKPNTLLPPHGVQVQLIQPEEPLILTAQAEQDMLAAINGADKTLVRVLFNYTHLHDINYQYGSMVDIFFREALPRNVIGAVSLINDDPDAPTAIISTTIFENNSNGIIDTPNILPTHISNFTGGTLVVGGERYTIESVIQTTTNGDNPQFVIRKNIDRNTLNPGSGQMVMAQSFSTPNISIEDRFMAVENMANADNWRAGIPLNFTVDLGEPNWSPQTDSYLNDEGQLISHEVGGIWDTATIYELTDDSTPTPQIIPEYYVVEFDSQILDHHPQYKDFLLTPNQPSVEWYKGIIRVDVENNLSGNKSLKILEIVRIENVGSTSTLRLVVHDPKFGAGETVKVGSQTKVNCFPGYRVYLKKDTAHGFTQTSLLPDFGEGSRKTLLGLASRDTQTQDAQGNDYVSPVGIPQIVYALEIVDPVPPQRPTGPKFATPPDFYSKATYTFETLFRQETFAAVFYRADTRAILKALYKPQTYDALISALPSLEDDEFYTDRIQHLLSFDYPDGVFSTFPNGDEDIGFPNPDNIQSGFNDSGNEDPATIIDKIKNAVFASFLPLTEHPLLYSEIKDGNYTPSPKKQKVKSRDGKVLQPGDPEYDNAPMAKRLTGTNKIRFTDFTLDGEMSKNTSYCYFVREMGNRMALSEPSEMLGPIRLVNKIAPEAPVIRKVTSRLPDAFTGDQASIDFQINEYPDSANIKMFHIYRALSAVDALTPRTMSTAKIIDVDLADVSDGIVSISDDFSDLDFLPYGDPIYYKITALREVKYQDVNGIDITELVPSKPSKTLLSNIVDIYNPAPPQISWDGVELPLPSDNTIVKEISALKLSWLKTTYKGSYTLMQLNRAGNWQTIFEITSNDEADLHYTLQDPLPKYDIDDEIELYHRFKVTVQNPSGLLNIEEQVITI